MRDCEGKDLPYKASPQMSVYESEIHLQARWINYLSTTATPHMHYVIVSFCFCHSQSLSKSLLVTLKVHLNLYDVRPHRHKLQQDLMKKTL